MHLITCINCGKNTYFMSEIMDNETCYYCGQEFCRKLISINNGKRSIEKRRCPRCKYFAMAQYSIKGRPDLGNWVVRTENISSVGLLILGSADLPIGDILEISLKEPTIASDKIILLGRIVRVSYNEEYPDRKHIGINIVKNGFSEQINNYVEKANGNKLFSKV